jgi:hypothetical protein
MGNLSGLRSARGGSTVGICADSLVRVPEDTATGLPTPRVTPRTYHLSWCSPRMQSGDEAVKRDRRSWDRDHGGGGTVVDAGGREHVGGLPQADAATCGRSTAKAKPRCAELAEGAKLPPPDRLLVLVTTVAIAITAVGVARRASARIPASPGFAGGAFGKRRRDGMIGAPRAESARAGREGTGLA